MMPNILIKLVNDFVHCSDVGSHIQNVSKNGPKYHLRGELLNLEISICTGYQFVLSSYVLNLARFWLCGPFFEVHGHFKETLLHQTFFWTVCKFQNIPYSFH